MREITFVLDDDALCNAIDQVAMETGSTFEEVVIRALELWKFEFELDEMELQKEEVVVAE